jgi:putative intracellular protease/amidase
LVTAARDFVRAFDHSRKPIVTLCHGPWVLASAGLLTGRTLTSWPGIRDDLVNAGATWLDRDVVRDRRLPQEIGVDEAARESVVGVRVGFDNQLVHADPGDGHLQVDPSDPALAQ